MNYVGSNINSKTAQNVKYDKTEILITNIFFIKLYAISERYKIPS